MEQITTPPIVDIKKGNPSPEEMFALVQELWESSDI